MTSHEIYIQRCLQLAKLGMGNVAPNPMVGSVLVYENRIIGEGYHQQYGKAHAEVNCLNSVQEVDKQLITQSTLYVSLEPCAHFGKTPPCAHLIIEKKITKVVIGCRDPFKEVDGKGIDLLKKAGIEVIVGVLEEKCIELNKRFFTFHTQNRPFIVLKWAETANRFIGTNDESRLLITDETTNRVVHKWRSEEAAILVGTKTALLDNPSLSNRFWSGNQPIRLVIDKELTLPVTLHLFDKKQSTIVFNYLQNHDVMNLSYCKLNRNEPLLEQIMHICYKRNIQSILIEGGRGTLQSFIDANLWDEAAIFTHKEMTIKEGTPSPLLKKQN